MDIEGLEPGQIVNDEVFLVAEAQLLVDRRGSNYYRLTLNHREGHQIEGKVWSDNLGDKIETGQFLEVLARVDSYMGQSQLNIQRYRVVPSDQVDESLYVTSTEIDVDAAFEDLFNWGGERFENEYLKLLMKGFYENGVFAAQFKTSPAASYHHHNYRGGLVEHTREVWDLAEKLCEHYEGHFDTGLVLCGAALHDVGKVKSYQLTGGISEHTDLGQLLDHIFISASMVSNACDRAVRADLPAEQSEQAAVCKTKLLHIVLSHHGTREWGSPVVPRTAEALLIHFCDRISATFQSCFEAIEKKPSDESWTELLRIMDQPRKLFYPTVDM